MMRRVICCMSCDAGIFISHPVKTVGCRRPATIGSLLIAVGGILSCFSPNLLWMYVLKGIIPGSCFIRLSHPAVAQSLEGRGGGVR